jgi:hypothetical protein
VVNGAGDVRPRKGFQTGAVAPALLLYLLRIFGVCEVVAASQAFTPPAIRRRSNAAGGIFRASDHRFMLT